MMFKKMVLLVFVPMLLSAMIAGGVASHGTTVYVDPKESMVKLCETFTINVNIADVSRLQGFDFCLSYDSTILEGLEVEEGPFMASFGATFVAYEEIDNDCKTECGKEIGRVWFVVALLGDAFADGSGTLATITFNATAPGESVLDLHSLYPYKPDEVKLVTCGPEPITNAAVDGYVVVSSDPYDPPEDPPPDPPTNFPNPDVNGDGVVDILDLAIVASLYGTSSGDPRYNPEADLNQNYKIDIHDIAIVARNFGRTS